MAALLHQARKALNATKYEYIKIKRKTFVKVHS
jgi:hypothetical protein